MKKYVVRNKKTNEVLGKFDTKNQASEAVVEYINEDNEFIFEFIYPHEDNLLTIFDFDIQEVEVQGINNYEEAIEFLGIKGTYKNGDMKTVETTPKHYKALLALSKLFMIAEAWNKLDGFVPDFSDVNQTKYFPWFEYSKDTAGFVCPNANWAAAHVSAYVGSRLCFATRERAADFGKKFESLYNDFLLLDN